MNLINTSQETSATKEMSFYGKMIHNKVQILHLTSNNTFFSNFPIFLGYLLELEENCLTFCLSITTYVCDVFSGT